MKVEAGTTGASGVLEPGGGGVGTAVLLLAGGPLLNGGGSLEPALPAAVLPAGTTGGSGAAGVDAPARPAVDRPEGPVVAGGGCTTGAFGAALPLAPTGGCGVTAVAGGSGGAGVAADPADVLAGSSGGATATPETCVAGFGGVSGTPAHFSTSCQATVPSDFLSNRGKSVPQCASIIGTSFASDFCISIAGIVSRPPAAPRMATSSDEPPSLARLSMARTKLLPH